MEVQDKAGFCFVLMCSVRVRFQARKERTVQHKALSILAYHL